MSKSIRKSATVVAIPAPPAVLSTTVETINDQAVTVEHLEPAPNTLKAADPVTPVLHVDQGVVDAFLNADGEVKQAAVALFRACVTRSVAPAQFLGRSDAKVRASEFNCAFAIGHQFGYDNARRIIDAACEQAGDKRANVLTALRKAKELGKQIKKAALKGAELKKAITRAGEEAIEFAESAENFAKEAKPRGAQLPRIPKSDSMDAWAPVALAALGDLLKSLGKVDVKPRQLSRVKELSELLKDAVDVLEGLTPGD
jgi:hypothetical protein